MNKKPSKKDNTIIMSDKYLSESGLQGGKVLGDHVSLFSFVVGIPLLILGVIALFGMILDFGLPVHAAGIIGAVLLTIIGLLLVIGGYYIYQAKKVEK